MNCPACDQPLQEYDPACQQCRFSLAHPDALFGQPPLIFSPITDPGHHLSGSIKRRLGSACHTFCKRFPQLHLTLLVLEKPHTAPAKPFLFWVFNRSTTHTAMEKGGNNRHLMLWIDPTARSASIMIGYGLEPLIDPETHLLPCLQTGAQALAAGQIGKAAAAMIAQLQSRLDTLAGQLPTAFGWMPDDLWQSMDDDEGLLTLHLEQRHLLNY